MIILVVMSEMNKADNRNNELKHRILQEQKSLYLAPIIDVNYAIKELS